MRLKYKIMLALIVVAMGLCFMTLQSYALWIARFESGENIAEVGCFSVNFLENQGPISLNNTYPISDTRALNAGVYYSFTVSNTCTTDSKYAVTINPIKSNTLTKDKIKYAIYKSTEAKPTAGINLGTVTEVNTDLSSFSNASAIDESLIVAEGYLKGATTNGGNDGESVTYILYLWMDENDTLADKNKTFEASVYVSNVAKRLPSAGETILGLVPDADPTDTSEIDNGTDESGCTNTLAYDDFGNLRYVGANPCNYVTFNGEEAGWRIIGVFENQIKLIRKESIGRYSWDTSDTNSNFVYGINQWGETTYENGNDYYGADLMRLLNPNFDNNLAEDGSGNIITGTYVNNSLYWNRASGNCYNGSGNTFASCDFTNSGLISGAKDLIVKSLWYLGTEDINGKGSAAVNLYEYERGSTNGKICDGGTQCKDKVVRTVTWEGYVGLMYPSDYGYAVGGNVRSSCLSKSMISYNVQCYLEDWLFTGDYQITISPHASTSTSNGVFYIRDNGQLYLSMATGVSSSSEVRPVVYISISNKMVGEGTQTDPYVLSLE